MVVQTLKNVGQCCRRWHETPWHCLDLRLADAPFWGKWAPRRLQEGLQQKATKERSTFLSDRDLRNPSVPYGLNSDTPRAAFGLVAEHSRRIHMRPDAASATAWIGGVKTQVYVPKKVRRWREARWLEGRGAPLRIVPSKKHGWKAAPCTSPES